MSIRKKVLKYFCLRSEVLHGWKIFACRKYPWSWKNLGFWKIFLIIEKSMLVKNLFNHEKLPWSSKSRCLWKYIFLREIFLMVKNSFLAENFLNHGKVIACLIFFYGKIMDLFVHELIFSQRFLSVPLETSKHQKNVFSGDIKREH